MDKKRKNSTKSKNEGLASNVAVKNTSSNMPILAFSENMIGDGQSEPMMQMAASVNPSNVEDVYNIKLQGAPLDQISSSGVATSLQQR